MTCKNELFHSSIYYGKDVSDGLSHYKYIDKYKSKSGKWVYVYNKIKKGIDTNKKVEAEEEGWKGDYDVSPASLKDKTGGTYSYDSKHKSSLKRTNSNETGSVTYNVKNGRQLFDSYSETTKITDNGNTKNVERVSNITYGYLHRATNTIQKGSKFVEKFLKKYF